MKKLISTTVLLLTFMSMASVCFAEKITTTLSRTKIPEAGEIYITGVDFSTSADILVTLPNNKTYVLDSVYVKSTDVDTLSAGATIVITEVTTADALVQTVLPLFSLSAGEVTDSVETLTPLTQNAARSRYVDLPKVATATTVGGVDPESDLSSGATISVGITNAVTPRNVVLTLVDDASADLAGIVTFNGTDWIGNTVVEIITVSAGTVSYTGSQPFRTITSAVYEFDATGQAADTLNWGYGVKLGVPYNTKTESGLVIHSVVPSTASPVVEAASATDTTFGTLTTTTAPDGTESFGVVYSTSGPASADAISGSNRIKITIVGSTATTDIKSIVMRVFSF